MAVTRVGELTTECNEEEDGHVKYTTTWLVVTDSTSDGARTVLAASGLPRRGDRYEFGSDTDGNASCRTRKVTYAGPEESRKKWIVTLDYSSKGSSENPDNTNNSTGDPIDWSWRCTGDTWSRMIAPDADINDRAFVNVCGEPFLPPPEVEKNSPLIMLEKNHPTLSLSVWAAAQGKVNSDAGRWGLGARCVKLRKWTFSQNWLDGGSMYFSNRMEVEIDPVGFYYQPPNLGLMYIDGFKADGTPNVRVIVDDKFVPVPKPQKLDQFGAVIPADGAAVFFDQAAGVLQKFELEDEYDFTGVLPAQLPGNFLNAV